MSVAAELGGEETKVKISIARAGPQSISYTGRNLCSTLKYGLVLAISLQSRAFLDRLTTRELYAV
jgi:hypothetical protein